MSKVIFVLAALCLVQFSVARVAREAPAPPPSIESAWNDLVKASRDTLDSLHTAILNLNNVRTDDELVTKVTTQAQTVGNTLQTEITALTAEAQKNAGKFDGVYKQFTDKLAEVANDLKSKNKDLFNGDAKKLQESIERGLRDVVKNSDDLKNKLKSEGETVSDKVEVLFAKIVDLASNGAKELSNTIKEKST